MRLYGLLEQLTKIILVNGKNVEILPEAQTGASDKVLKIPAMGNDVDQATQEIVLVNQAQTLKNKTIDASLNPISNIVDANIKSDAAIAGTKISPNFGAQNIETTGSISASVNITADAVLKAKGQLQVEANTAADAVYIQQLGGGKALVIEDAANVDPTSLVVDSSGNLGVGVNPATALTEKVTVDGNISVSSLNGLVSSAASGELRIGHDANTSAVKVGTGANVATVEVGATSGAVQVHADSLDFTGSAPEIGLANGVTLTVGDSSTTIVTPGDLQAKDVVVTGNLTVQGTTTSIDTTNLEVKDQNILVNKGGDATSAEGAGLSVEVGGSPVASLKYEAALTSKFKLGVEGSEVEVADVSSSQDLLNKKVSSTGAMTGALELPSGTEGQRPGTPVEGMIRYNSDSDSFEGYAAGAWAGIGGGGTVDKVEQTAHGFVVGDVLWLDGSEYKKASAAADNTAEVVGMVSRVIDANIFEMTLSGEVEGLSGLTVGSVYFLSASVEGGITDVEPSVVGQVSLPVGVASSASSLYVAPKRGVVVGAANLRTQIGLSENASTNIQKITSYSAGELAGWVELNATTDYKFYVQAQFVKNAAGAWNLSYQTTGDTPPAGFSMDVNDSTEDYIEVTLPAMAGFVDGKINFALNAPAVGTSLPLQVDSTSVNFSEIKASSSAGLTFKEDGGTEVGSVSDAGAWAFGPEVQSGVDGAPLLVRTGDQGLTAEYSPTKHGTVQIANIGSSTAVPAVLGITADNTVGLALGAATPNTNTIYDMSFNVRQNNGDDFTTLTTDAFQWQRFSTKLGACTRAGDWTLGAGFGNTHTLSGKVNIESSITAPTAPLRVYNGSAVLANYIMTGHSNVGGANALRWRVECDGDTISATGSYTSDERAKKNLEPLQYGLSEILKLQPKAFNWWYEEDAEVKSFCVSTAQEVQAIMPEMVREDGLEGPDGEQMKAIYEKEIMAVMVKAIQEQQAQIEEMKAEIAALKAK